MPLLDSTSAKQLSNTAYYTLNFLQREWFRIEDLRGRHGGYYCMLDPKVGIIGVKKIGAVRHEKRLKYESFCQEKATRLKGFPEHLLSLQSRDEVKNQWGGAVRGHKLLHSFSGLTEELDSLLSIGVALSHNDLKEEEVRDIFRLYFPNIPFEFVERYLYMSETDFEYGHIL